MISDWLPPAAARIVQALRREYHRSRVGPILRRNAELKNRHEGARCFILATGPSIARQDIAALEGEWSIGLSNFFVHKDYRTIRPRYHAIPKICVPPMTEEDAIRWLRDMDAKTGDAEIVLSIGDRNLVERERLFRGRQVRYLFHWGDWEEGLRDVDLTRALPMVQSSPVLALQLALYMGAREIYLLGCDHDWLLHHGESRHFYPEERHAGTNRPGFTEWTELEHQFLCYRNLWKQYRLIRDLAARRKATIFNATPGSMLDVFPRIELQSVLKLRPLREARLE
jgi:hypothetical protein